MLLQILIMYAGSKMFFGIDLSPFTSAIIAIALNSAAYEDNDDMDKLEIVDLLMFAGKVVVGSTYLGLEPYIVAAGFYFIMTFTLGRIISLIERRMKKSDSR